MFSPDDFTTAAIAIPYVAFTTKTFVKSSRAAQTFASKPGYCKYLPWFCYF